MNSDQIKPQAPTPKKFRLDINGLRGYAVLFVVLFHFGVPGFGGGFVGVDIFFVISGYLMTSIILSGLENNNFSIARFYLARARRIVPALIALCMLLLLLGWLILPPLEYQEVAKNVIYSISFASNFFYYFNSGYFAVASEQNWLLHTWSLSVEWQFYLLLPLVLFFLALLKTSKKTLFYLFVVGIFFSLALSVYVTGKDMSMAFYYLPTRAWEMMAGGVIYFLPMIKESKSRLFEFVGFGLIAISLLVFDGSSGWPGWRAVLPVTGAFLVLLANREASVLTANPFVQWLGTSSYSIYLYHWPIVVLLKGLALLESPLWLLSGILCSLLFGWISYKLVESPARYWLTRTPSGVNISALGLAVASVIAPAVVIAVFGGVGGRLPVNVELAEAARIDQNPRRDECLMEAGSQSPGCVYGEFEPGVVVLGDSHANAIVTAVAEVFNEEEQSVIEWSYSGCLTMFGVKRTVERSPEHDCSGFNQWVKDTIESQGNSDIPVVIANRWTWKLGDPATVFDNVVGNEGVPEIYFNQRYASTSQEFLAEVRQAMTNTICFIAKYRPVYLLRPIPEMAVDVPFVLSRRLSVGFSGDISISREDYNRRHAFVIDVQNKIAASCGVEILDPLPYLCNANRCFGSVDNVPLYFDDDHLCEDGNKKISELFRTVIQD